MRTIVMALIVCFAVTGIGLTVCGLANWDAHQRAMLIAGCIALIASAAGAVPLRLARKSDQAMAAQAGLVATTVHLLAGIALAGFALLILKLGQPFTFWLFAFYGMTLIIVAVESVRLVKAAPPVQAKVAPKQ